MKNLLLGAAMLSIATTSAMAHGSNSGKLLFNGMATVTDVQPVYKTVSNNNSSVRMCEDIQVEKTRYEYRTRTVTERVQNGTGTGNTSDALAGAVIGGIIGKTATGKDNGAAAGAVIGAIIANENSKKNNNGYTTVERQIRERVPVTYYETQSQCSSQTVGSAIAILEDRIAQTQQWAASANANTIRMLQARIGVTVDGVKGPATRRATSRYIWSLEDKIEELQAQAGTSSSQVVDYYKVSARYDGQRFTFTQDEPVNVGDRLPVTVSVDIK